jgi:hypothetical protein
MLGEKMTTFTDESRFWVVFDTCTASHYYPDLHKLLATPPGSIIRYEYRAKWLSDEVAKALEKKGDLPARVLLAYAQGRTYLRGQPAPKEDESGNFEDLLLVPTRIARLVNVVRDGTEFYFDLRLEAYPALQETQIFRELFARHEAPYWKWVAFSSRTGDLEALEAGVDDEKWRSLVETLFIPPSQFAGDIFWRLNGIKESGQADYLTPADHYEVGGNGLAQVTSVYSLVEDRVYSTELTTLRSPAPRAGGQHHKVEIVAKSGDDKVVQLVGSGRFDVRQYTSTHMELEARHLEALMRRKLEISLETEPPDGDWPQGPRLVLKVVVGKNWTKVWLGAVAGFGGLMLGASAVSEFFKGQAGILPVTAGAGSVLLIAIGLTVLTGKPQLK